MNYIYIYKLNFERQTHKTMIILLKTNNLSLNHEYLKFDAIFIKIEQLRIYNVFEKILLYIYDRLRSASGLKSASNLLPLKKISGRTCIYLIV